MAIYVPPDGLVELARIAIVGEAPGREEEKQGRPFVGQSGKLVRGCIAAAGVSPTRILLTNAVQVRPTNPTGGNRKPTDEEIDSWIPVLKKQIYCTHLVVILGASALRAVSQSLVPGQMVVTLDHPNYVIRRGSLKKEWMDNLISILQTGV